jgi:hypothetical protein
MAATVDPQEGMFDRVVEDGDLISALEEREKRRASAKTVQAKYAEAHDKAKALIDAYNIGDGEIVRAGRFRIKITRTASREVSFETSASRRMRISTLDDE